MTKIGIVGAGIVGRCAALALARAGYSVTLYDKAALSDHAAVSFVAAGMLAPASEAATLSRSEYWLYALGQDAVARWQALIETLPTPVYLSTGGSLYLARPADQALIEDLKRRLHELDPKLNPTILDQDGLAALEPDLVGVVNKGLFIKNEGAVHARQAMDGLAAAICAHQSISVREGQPVSKVAAHSIDREPFDLVIDCRGFGAACDLSDLRGVRGELVELNAPGFHLRRPCRIPHTRYSIYLVPRGGNQLVVGATALESEDAGPPSVTSVLELLGAVYSLHPALRMANVTRLAAGVRPAFFDNLPQIRVAPGIMHLNGLYRHGFLLAPAVSAALTDYIIQTLDLLPSAQGPQHLPSVFDRSWLRHMCKTGHDQRALYAASTDHHVLPCGEDSAAVWTEASAKAAASSIIPKLFHQQEVSLEHPR